MTEPGREPVAGIVLHGAHFSRRAERIRDTLGRPLVIGREGDAHMTIVEDGIVGAIGFRRSGSNFGR